MNEYNPFEWSVIEQIKEYFIWVRDEDGFLVYQATKGEIPTNDAGYYNKQSLLAIKNLV